MLAGCWSYGGGLPTSASGLGRSWLLARSWSDGDWSMDLVTEVWTEEVPSPSQSYLAVMVILLASQV